MKEKLVIAGGTGLVGKRLVQLLDQSSYEISILTRGNTRIENEINYIHWNPYAAVPEIESSDTFDHIINLAGAGIVDKRWRKSRKKILLESRTLTTAALQELVNHSKLKSYIGASAIGYYGDTKDRIISENAGDCKASFLSKICVAWEKAHLKYKALVATHIILRMGIVVSSLGGALPKIKASIPFGIAPYLGHGNQYYSWIHIDDLCHLIIGVLQGGFRSGIYNAVSPSPMQHKDFINNLKVAMQKSAYSPSLPEFFIKLLLGESATTILDSNRISAQKLLQSGFKFRFPNLLAAIQDVLANKI